MDRAIDAVNMSLYSPGMHGLSTSTGHTRGEISSGELYQNMEPKTLNERDLITSSLHNRSIQRANGHDGNSERNEMNGDDHSHSKTSDNADVSAQAIHETTKFSAAKAPTACNQSRHRLGNESKDQENKTDNMVYMKLAASFIDDYDHVLEEADYLSRSFESLRDEMKFITVKNAILMDSLATIGLDL